MLAFQRFHMARVPMGVGLGISPGDLTQSVSSVQVVPGARLVRHGGYVHLDGESLIIKASDYEIWEPRVSVAGLPACDILRLTTLLERILVEAMLRSHHADGLGALITAAHPTNRAFARAARRAVHRFQCALSDLALRMSATRAGAHGLDLGHLKDAASGLLGLGPGLTPSGDDFLIGWLASTCLIGGAWREVGKAVALEIARLARSKTNIISAQYINHAARCEWSELLGNLLVLCSRMAESQTEEPDSVERTSRAAARLLSLGAASGADTLAGLITGLKGATTCCPPF